MGIDDYQPLEAAAAAQAARAGRRWRAALVLSDSEFCIAFAFIVRGKKPRLSLVRKYEIVDKSKNNIQKDSRLCNHCK